MRRKNVMYSDYFKYALNDILSLLVSSISYKKSLENFFVFEMFELKSSVAEGNTLPLKLTTDRNVCACQIQVGGRADESGWRRFRHPRAVALGRRDRHTQRTINSTERKRANETEGNGQSRKQKQVAKAVAKFGAAR